MKIYTKGQKKIAEKISASADISKWKDWRWHVKHNIKDLDTIERLLDIKFDHNEKKEMQRTIEKFPMSITPYYLSLIDRNDYKNDPIFKQSVVDPRELNIGKYDMKDPLAEDKDSPVPGITHRYPDRVLFLVSNVCSMYCRHCTRKRKVGDVDSIPSRAEIQQGIDYIKDHKEIRDVLLSGGDPFLLSDKQIDWLLKQIYEIPHVEMIRIGTRTPCVLPYRITDDLVNIIKKYHPVWINTHFNHPREITKSSQTALRKLVDAGIPMGNQSVLLADVNDCPRIIKKLNHKLVHNRVRPYYIYQCDLSEGLTHFRTPVGKGIEIMESLIGHTSGLAIPRFVIDAPGGGGKIPVMPNYIISWSTNKVILRNYEGVITTYNEPASYEPKICDRKCNTCELTLNLEQADESKAIGIEKLLDDQDETISLTPMKNDRFDRRNGYSNEKSNENSNANSIGNSEDIDKGRSGDIELEAFNLKGENKPIILPHSYNNKKLKRENEIE